MSDLSTRYAADKRPLCQAKEAFMSSKRGSYVSCLFSNDKDTKFFFHFQISGTAYPLKAVKKLRCFFSTFVCFLNNNA